MRRVITITIISIVISVIVSYLTAWVCLHFAQWGLVNREMPLYAEVNSPELFDAQFAREMSGSTPMTFMVQSGVGVRYILVMYRKTNSFASLTLGDQPDGVGRRVEAGWPFRCVTGWYVDNMRATPPTRRQSGLLDPLQTTPPQTSHPYRPLWSGLALNALVMCVPVWLIMGLVGRARRSRRRARGLCVHCKYSLKGIESPQCPECGANRPLTLPRA